MKGKKLRILKNILMQTKADKMLIGYLGFVLLSAVAILVFEPGIHSYFDSLWFCFSVITTTGFGDVVVTTALAKIVTVLLSIYSVLVIAIVTGVVVNYYTKIIEIKNDTKQHDCTKEKKTW